MKLSGLLFLCAVFVIAASWYSNTGIWKQNKTSDLSKKKIEQPLKTLPDYKLKEKSVTAKSFVLKKGFNAEICFFIDMSLPSGQNRFFVYNMKTDSLQAQGLVAHGNCFQNWLEGRKYSNVVGCGCTSLGKYKIGNMYTGKFGYSYKLYGLDSTNDNAFERTVVLHAHRCVPESEVMDEICQSNGCPMVSPGFLEQIKKIINTSHKPVLLWIYE